MDDVHLADRAQRAPSPLPAEAGTAQWYPRPSLGWIRPRIALVALALAVLAVAAPALRGELTAGRTFLAIPGYWLEASTWLSTNAPVGRALVVPGSSFGTYLWGNSRDEPMQPYSNSPWAVRDAVPLSSAGNIRSLDAVETLLSSGAGDPHLADYLSRMGVSQLVVRNDLNYAASDAPRPSLVHQALDASGGFTRVAAFGPLLTGFEVDGLVADSGIDGAYNAVEIYAVDAAAPDQRVVLRPAVSPWVLGGEAESLLGVAGLRGAADAVVVRTGDQPAPDGSIGSAHGFGTSGRGGVRSRPREPIPHVGRLGAVGAPAQGARLRRVTRPVAPERGLPGRGDGVVLDEPWGCVGRGS